MAQHPKLLMDMAHPMDMAHLKDMAHLMPGAPIFHALEIL